MGQYTIQAGDVFFTIAQKLNVSLDALEAANPGVDINNLKVGQVINTPGSSDASSGGGPTEYTIQAGDNFFSIAQKFNISLQELQNANQSVDEDNLQVGQTIRIP